MKITRPQLQAFAALGALAITAVYILWSGWGLIWDLIVFPAKFVPQDGPLTWRQMLSFLTKACAVGCLLITALTLPAFMLAAWFKKRGTPLGGIIDQAKIDTKQMLDGQARREKSSQEAKSLQDSTPNTNTKQGPRRL